MRLQGKYALVTGSTSGIGQATAEAFAREGATVAVTGRDEARGRAVVDGISAAGGHAVFIPSSLATVADARGLATETIRILGQIDILVNNAGVYMFSPSEGTAEADYDTMMTTNVKIPFFLTTAITPEMAHRGQGKVINITTMAAHFGMPGAAAYGASKAAVTLLTKAWAAEYGARGINVNAISPGPIQTPGSARLGDVLDQLAQSLPAGRPGRPEEVAAAAVYLASDEAAFMHGATLTLDGGRTAI